MSIDDIIFELMSNGSMPPEFSGIFERPKYQADPNLGAVIHTYEVDGIQYEVHEKRTFLRGSVR